MKYRWAASTTAVHLFLTDPQRICILKLRRNPTRPALNVFVCKSLTKAGRREGSHTKNMLGAFAL